MKAKEANSIKYLDHCSACISYRGHSPDTLGRIECSNEECAAYYNNAEEYCEEGNHEIIPPNYWEISCQWMVKR